MKSRQKRRKLRDIVHEQNVKMDARLIKGKYYYIDYSALSSADRRQALNKGMQAGGIRIIGGVLLILLCIIVLVVIAQRV